MTWYAIGRAGGSIRMYIRNQAQAAAQRRSGEVVLESDDDLAEAISADGLSLIGPVQSLADQKEAKWIAARDYRDEVSASGCETPVGRVQTDLTSYQRILGAMMSAQVGDFSVNWTMADNTVVPLNAEQVIAMGMAVTAFFGACQDAGDAIRQAIDAAADLEELDAIDITAGYPA